MLAGEGVGEDARRNRAAAAVERGARNEREAQAIAIRKAGRLLGGGDSWKDELDSALITVSDHLNCPSLFIYLCLLKIVMISTCFK